MPLPEHTRALLYAGADWVLPGEHETFCEGSRFHSPTPLFVQRVALVPEDWDGPVGPSAWLCGTCRDNLDLFQQILFHTDGHVPWQVRREFGNTIRALADRGWRVYCDGLEPTNGNGHKVAS